MVLLQGRAKCQDACSMQADQGHGWKERKGRMQWGSEESINVRQLMKGNGCRVSACSFLLPLSL